MWYGEEEVLLTRCGSPVGGPQREARENQMRALLFIVKSVLYGWVAALRDLCAVLCKLLQQWCRRMCSGKVPTRDRCVPINDPAFVRPDPLIYDQYYLAGLGLAVTWDNPDIQLYLNGAPVSSSLLLPGTTYEIVAQVWNNSTEAPVVGMPVVFSYLDFGVGTVSVPIGSTTIDLGVKGGPGCPAYAKMFWTTPDRGRTLLPSGAVTALRRQQPAE
jgi:hypothetical protein